MNIYCLVNRLKKECVDEYRRYHLEAHKTHWKSQIEAIREAGAQVCNTYIFEDLSIVVIGCDDLEACLKKLAENEENQKWQEIMAGFFAQEAVFDGSKKADLQKIFDLSGLDPRRP